MENKYKETIKAKLAELDVLNRVNSKFEAKDLIPGQGIEPVDINDMAIAFSKEDLILEELKLLLEQAYPSPKNHDEVVGDFKNRIADAALRLKEAEKRGL